MVIKIVELMIISLTVGCCLAGPDPEGPGGGLYLVISKDLGIFNDGEPGRL
jgi:hypothetical protein